MRTIYKYNLSPTDKQEIKLPAGYKILSVAVQHEEIRLWVLVNTESNIPLETVNIFIFGTGHPMPMPLIFIGTVLLYNETLVFHVFTDR